MSIAVSHQIVENFTGASSVVGCLMTSQNVSLILVGLGQLCLPRVSADRHALKMVRMNVNEQHSPQPDLAVGIKSNKKHHCEHLFKQ